MTPTKSKNESNYHTCVVPNMVWHQLLWLPMHCGTKLQLPVCTEGTWCTSRGKISRCHHGRLSTHHKSGSWTFPPTEIKKPYLNIFMTITTLVKMGTVKTLTKEHAIFGPGCIHTAPSKFQIAALSTWLDFPSTLRRWNLSPKTELFENAR